MQGRSGEVAIPPASGSALAVLEVVVDATPSAAAPRRTSIGVVSVHLAGSVQERAAQAEALTQRYSSSPHPVVLGGDFNGRPDDPVVRRLGEAWTIAPNRAPAFTYPADAPDREIDFMMWRPGTATEDPRRPFVLVEHRVIDEPLASDHRPILIVLEVR
jgi:endonuclease/exonuclease/phosphatase family metal-dependent hydrolase